MAEGSASFDWDMAVSVAGNHYTSSGHGGVAQHFVHNDGGAPAGAVVVPGAGSRASGGISKMDPTSLPGYGSSDGPTAITATTQALPPARSSGQGLTQFKRSWTVEEDTLLREKVREFDQGSWAEVALYLPGRSGKQCRERWTNQLDPNIERKKWTEVEDMKLIKMHQTWGNCWSVIVRELPGRSDNAVKNHWNATKRSLNTKRHMKKRNSEQPPPGQLSLLMEYIRSLDPHTEPPTETRLVSPPLYHDQQHGGKTRMADIDSVVVIAPTAQAHPSYPNLTMTGMYYHPNPANMQYWVPDLNVTDGTKEGYSYYIPPNAHLNHHQSYGLSPTQMVSKKDIQQAANASMDMYAFTEQHTLPVNNLKAAAEMHRESSINNQLGNMCGGAGGWSYYYGMDAAGSSGPTGGSGSGNDPEGIDMV
ncbi:hypothetical protein CFC21_001037 [Triticum aestivum]|uniref:Uncharacterized protein n=1 Tax=Triticum aestivum TaxID=4565 RepID=A0A3B5XVR2_WHEAT|nr:transcription factor MYB122-like [Triticum aestivum]KAF6982678.1 hypothetical protein CFC21_001037 [Triticum aestivum]